MKQIKALRAEIINKLWTYTTTDAKRSPEFLKWLEALLSEHSIDIINECRDKAEGCEFRNEIEVAIMQVKKQLK